MLFTVQSCLTLAVVSPPLVPSDWQLTEITLAEFYLPSQAQRAPTRRKLESRAGRDATDLRHLRHIIIN